MIFFEAKSTWFWMVKTSKDIAYGNIMDVYTEDNGNRLENK